VVAVKGGGEGRGRALWCLPNSLLGGRGSGSGSGTSPRRCLIFMPQPSRWSHVERKKENQIK